MYRPLTALAIASITLLSAPSFADDTLTRATPTDHELIKTCMEKQKTSNVAQSKDEMKRYCKSELKRQKATGEMPEPPPADTPHDPPPQ